MTLTVSEFDYDTVVSQLELRNELRKEREMRMTDTTTDKPPQFNWTNPLDRLTWQKTFRTRATRMTLRDGKEYIIEYRPGVDRDGQKVTKAWVKIADGIAPCGWFTVEKVLSKGWVSSNA